MPGVAAKRAPRFKWTLRRMVSAPHSIKYCRRMLEIFPIFNYNWNIAKYFQYLITIENCRNSLVKYCKIFPIFNYNLWNIAKYFQYLITIEILSQYFCKILQNISNIQLQLKYCRNILVKYCKIFPIFNYNWNIVAIFLCNIAKHFQYLITIEILSQYFCEILQNIFNI